VQLLPKAGKMKYYFFDGSPGWTGFKIVEFTSYDDMIEAVRRFHLAHDFLPTVYHGTKLEFEPAEIVKSWKAANVN
jgi:hypothetical protein